MRIEIIGHEEEYLLQTLALCFFPAINFSKEHMDGLSLQSTLENQWAKTILNVEDQTYSATEKAVDEEDQIAAIARSFYQAAKQATGIEPPWGTLTGIRPSKKTQSVMAHTAGDIAEIMEEVYYTKPHKTALAMAVLDGEKAAMERLDTEAVSLYIGIPFCPSRCSYCSFVSHTMKEAGQYIPAYLEMLKREVHLVSEMLQRSKRKVQTLYIGGGTPTTLTEEQLLDLMQEVGNGVDIKHLDEYTVEAGRVDTITLEKLSTIKAQGANRISVNAQSTNDETLRNIGRTHSAEEFFQRYGDAKKMGFSAVNVDLIAGLPKEAPAVFEKSLHDVMGCSPENLTIHTLSLKRAALLVYADMQKNKEDVEMLTKMLDHASKKMAGNGYFPYYLYRQRNTLGNLENVGYTKVGHECLYNVYTMGEYQSIVALGGGGVSKVVGLPNGKIERIFNYKHFYEYSKDFEKIRKNIETIENLLKMV